MPQKNKLIKKGTHTNYFRLPKLVFFAKTIAVGMTATPEMVYEPLGNGATNQINKIVGYGHKERLGWVGDYYEDGIEVGLYTGSVKVGNKKASFSSFGKLHAGDSLYLEFDLEGIHQFVTYINQPYFGGKAKAPKDIVLNYNYKVINRGIPDSILNVWTNLKNKWLKK